MDKKQIVVIGIIAVICLVIFALGVMGLLCSRETQSPVQVSPQAVSQTNRPMWIVVNSTSITQATNFTAYDWASLGYSLADVYYSIDQGTATNTLTITLQVSPDKSTFLSHSTNSALLTASSADTTSYTPTIPVHLQHFRIAATVANTNTVTPTIKVYLH